MVQVKGFAIRGLLKSVKEAGWPIAPLLASLPEEDRAAFARPIVASASYPYGSFVSLARSVDRVHGKGDLALCRDLGRRAAARDLGTTFRIISAMASIEFLLRRAQVFWAAYCDRGKMVLETSAEKSYRGRLEGFPEIDRAHCVIVEGWLEGMGTALGAQDMAVKQVQCAAQGGAVCEYEGRWSAMRGLFR